MLKIKNSVDLKELEKFGFIFDNMTGIYIKRIHQHSELRVRCWDKQLFQSNYNSINTQHLDLDLLYDLIKANLVEKMEE